MIPPEPVRVCVEAAVSRLRFLCKSHGVLLYWLRQVVTPVLLAAVHKSSVAAGIDEIVEKLLAEMKQPTSGRGTSSPGFDTDEERGR
jgi:hypothetical protein